MSSWIYSRNGFCYFSSQTALIYILSFELIRLWVKKENFKMDCEEWRLCLPLWILDQNISSIVYLQVAPILPTKFRVNSSFGSGELQKRFFKTITIASILDCRLECL